MKRLLISLMVIIALSGCASKSPEIPTPDIKTIGTQIAATMIAGAVQTQQAKPMPSQTVELIQPTPTLPLTEKKAQIIDVSKNLLEVWDDVESVNLVRGNNGTLEIEIKTIWASKDNQSKVSYDLIKIFAKFFSTYIRTSSETELSEMMGGQGKFAISITTYSTDNDYRYKSLTDLATLIKVEISEISYDEWVISANAGFR